MLSENISPASKSQPTGFPRDALPAATEAHVDFLDQIDGDLDEETNGDELDGNSSEDDFMDHSLNWLGQPGCPIADPDYGAEEAGEREEA